MKYGGSRLRTTAALAGARIPITVDVGFGDAVEPGVEDIDLPVLLDMPLPHLRTYPPETVIAEKLHAMVVLGLANSRTKDYYDVWMLLTTFDLEAQRLTRAIPELAAGPWGRIASSSASLRGRGATPLGIPATGFGWRTPNWPTTTPTSSAILWTYSACSSKPMRGTVTPLVNVWTYAAATISRRLAAKVRCQPITIDDGMPTPRSSLWGVKLPRRSEAAVRPRL